MKDTQPPQKVNWTFLYQLLVYMAQFVPQYLWVLCLRNYISMIWYGGNRVDNWISVLGAKEQLSEKKTLKEGGNTYEGVIFFRKQYPCRGNFCLHLTFGTVCRNTSTEQNLRPETSWYISKFHSKEKTSRKETSKWKHTVILKNFQNTYGRVVV